MEKVEKLRILFLSSWFPDRNQPTLGNFVKRHAQAVALKHDVVVVHAVADSSISEEEWVHQKDGNYEEYILYHPPKWPRYFRHPKYLRKAVNKYLDEGGERPDLIHLNVLYPAGRQAIRFHDEWGVPLVASEHWTGYHNNTHSAIKAWELKVMKGVGERAYKLLPVTHHLASAMEKAGVQGNYDTVANVVDTDLFDRKSPHDGPFRFLHVSSLFDKLKNVSGLFNAFAKLLEKNDKVFLEIIGDGDTAPHIEKAKALNIPSDKISFAGEKTIQEIADRMKKSDAFVLFSNYENLPCVIGEAWSTGTPVISSDVGGISEHLNREKGMLVQPRNEGELLAAMQSIIQLQHQYNGDDLRSYAVKHFSNEAICEAFSQIYHQAIAAQK